MPWTRSTVRLACLCQGDVGSDTAVGGEASSRACLRSCADWCNTRADSQFFWAPIFGMWGRRSGGDVQHGRRGPDVDQEQHQHEHLQLDVPETHHLRSRVRRFESCWGRPPMSSRRLL